MAHWALSQSLGAPCPLLPRPRVTFRESYLSIFQSYLSFRESIYLFLSSQPECKIWGAHRGRPSLYCMILNCELLGFPLLLLETLKRGLDRSLPTCRKSRCCTQAPPGSMYHCISFFTACVLAGGRGRGTMRMVVCKCSL